MNPDTLESALAALPSRALPSAIFNIAHAYARAAEDSWRQISETSDADFAAPAILCQSFAIELLLKFFIVREQGKHTTMADLNAKGINLRGHSCTSLFRRLSSATQDKIAASYSSLAGTEVDPAAFATVLKKLGDDPFVTWRYPYEVNALKQLDKPLLDRVTYSLGKAAEAERRAAT